MGLREYGQSDDWEVPAGDYTIGGPLFGQTIPPAPDATMQGRNPTPRHNGLGNFLEEGREQPGARKK